ncbi:hypothetical protein VTL71DRAFT_11440 [Oculimacula yallundae]|uniref:2EXR domain-containing protein n=1 Tax=Oculimacula yallundae TaxID=86028 RepID=A0ABR4CQ26_9HELO
MSAAAPPAALNAFTLFTALPLDVRVMIWKQAAGKDIAKIIDVEIRCTNPIYVRPLAHRPVGTPDRARGGTRAHVRYTWTCVAIAGVNAAEGSDALLGVNIESRMEYLRYNPQFLHIEHGPYIYFKAIRDVIYMDAISLYTLHMYTWMQDHLLPVPNVMANLQGFDTILNLESGMMQVSYVGLRTGGGYFANDAVLAGLRRPIMQRATPPGTAAFQLSWDLDNSGVGAALHVIMLSSAIVGLAGPQMRVVNRHFGAPPGAPPPPGVNDDVLAFFL